MRRCGRKVHDCTVDVCSTEWGGGNKSRWFNQEKKNRKKRVTIRDFWGCSFRSETTRARHVSFVRTQMAESSEEKKPSSPSWVFAEEKRRVHRVNYISVPKDQKMLYWSLMWIAWRWASGDIKLELRNYEVMGWELRDREDDKRWTLLNKTKLIMPPIKI